MAKNRSRLDITRDILAAIAEKRGEIKPTHLMYKSNLSHKQMQGYLEELVANHFISKTHRNDREYITLTDQGFKLLQKIEDMKDFQSGFAL